MRHGTTPTTLAFLAVNVTGIGADSALMMGSSNGRPMDSRLRGNDTHGKVGSKLPRRKRRGFQNLNTQNNLNCASLIPPHPKRWGILSVCREWVKE